MIRCSMIVGAMIRSASQATAVLLYDAGRLDTASLNRHFPASAIAPALSPPERPPAS